MTARVDDLLTAYVEREQAYRHEMAAAPGSAARVEAGVAYEAADRAFRAIEAQLTEDERERWKEHIADALRTGRL